MANTINFLTYANTFAHWVITTNALVKENNDFAANNFVKPTGTLFLNDPSLGLQVANNAIISGQLSNLGTGSSTYIQNVLRVDGFANLSNTSVSLYAAGTVNANGPNNGLYIANNTLMAGNLRVLGTTTMNVLTANTITGNLVSTNLVANTLTANTLIINTKLEANNAPISYFNNLITQGQLTVGGNFVINGSTVYNANVFTLNAGSSLAFDSTFAVNRGIAGANAEIKWSEADQYWAIRDVNNSTSYSKILTANLISSSLTSTSSDTFASSAAANTLNTNIQSAFAQANAANNLAQSAFNKANTGGATFVGTSGVAVSSNGVLSFSSNNGVTISGTSNVVTISTPQDLRTSASPTFAGLTLSTALPINQGGTGSTSASAALNALLPTGTVAGYVLTTGGAGSFYWGEGGGGGGGGATPGTTINSTRLSYTAEGNLNTYPTPTYVPGASQLRVYFDGVRQFASEYTETSNTSVTFTSNVPAGVNILLEVDGYIVNPYYANNIAYSVNADISGTANTIQLAIDGLTSKVVTNYANTSASINFTNLITATTPSTNASNTQVATTAFVKNSLNNGNTYTHSITGSAGSVANTGIIGLVGPTITDDTTSSDTKYITFTTQTTGTQTIANVSSSKLTFVPSTGTLSATVMTSTSDENLKENVVEISDALNTVMKLKGVEYNWKDTSEKGMGLIAQDVEKILPYLVSENENGKSIMYQNMVGLLIEAIKELKLEIDTLKGDNK